MDRISCSDVFLIVEFWIELAIDVNDLMTLLSANHERVVVETCQENRSDLGALNVFGFPVLIVCLRYCTFLTAKLRAPFSRNYKYRSIVILTLW